MGKKMFTSYLFTENGDKWNYDEKTWQFSSSHGLTAKNVPHISMYRQYITTLCQYYTEFNVTCTNKLTTGANCFSVSGHNGTNNHLHKYYNFTLIATFGESIMPLLSEYSMWNYMHVCQHTLYLTWMATETDWRWLVASYWYTCTYNWSNTSEYN